MLVDPSLLVAADHAEVGQHGAQGGQAAPAPGPGAAPAGDLVRILGAAIHGGPDAAVGHRSAMTEVHDENRSARDRVKTTMHTSTVTLRST